jgi:glutamate/tyrosine decarboxylase-like PLP-dependent enzyme
MNHQTHPIRHSPTSLDLDAEQFRQIGHTLVDRIADFLASLEQRPVGPGESPDEIRAALGERPLPQTGRDPGELLEEAAGLLFDHSVLTAHPRHLAYIIGSPAPLAALADLLAAVVNPNVSSWWRAGMATEMENQVIRWIAELVGYPADCGGLLVSGGSMANYVGFLAARKAVTPWEVRSRGLLQDGCQPLRLYASDQTHTWIEKAADSFGLGTDSIRWISSDARQRVDLESLRRQIHRDRQHGELPLMVVGNAGTTATGAVDPLVELAALCKEEQLWFHVDGAYGAFAALLPDAPADLHALHLADSLALDPHKWLYQPLEAGCVLVRDANLLRETFTYHPPYYHFPVEAGQEPVNYYQLGLQNSRGFRALKVWLSIQQAGAAGYRQMIADDIRLAVELHHLVEDHPELQAVTQNLSIATFRYIPPDLSAGDPQVQDYLDRLNSAVLMHIQSGGQVYLSNAIVDGRFLLRACVVNFRTRLQDIQPIPQVVVEAGRTIDASMRMRS